MRERIKKIRKHFNLTQVKFGEQIGVKGNTVTNYETGLRTPTDAVIKSICREFHIREEWLRFGEGEMFIEMARDEQISEFVGGILTNESDSFKKRLISVLANLTEEEWKILEKKAKELVNEKRDWSPQPQQRSYIVINQP